MKKYDCPEWISSRIYKTENETRAVISNEKDREFIELEGNAAQLWDKVLEFENEFDADLISNKINKPLNEVKKFLLELQEINLIRIKNNSEENKINNKIENYKNLKNLNTSERFSKGSYYEAVPGGSNELAENNFMAWAAKNGFLYSTGWELTYRCNERCIHCFNPGASHVEGDKSYRKVEELDLEQIKSTIDDLKKIGVFRILLTGGEIFLRKDIFEIIKYIKKLRFSLTIFTNGTLLKYMDVDLLQKLYPYRVELSLYSSDPIKHDKITRLKNSWQKTVDITKYMVSRNIKVQLKMIVMKETVNDTDQFRKLCDELNVESVVDFNMSPGVDGSKFPVEKLLPEPEKLIRQCFDNLSPLYVGTLKNPNSYDPKKLANEAVCGAGCTTMNITAEGNISPCNALPLEYGNLKKNKMSEIWTESSVGKKEDNYKYSLKKSNSNLGHKRLSSWQGVVRKDYEICGNFKRCSWCQKCPGLAYLETGNELKPSTTSH